VAKDDIVIAESLTYHRIGERQAGI